MCGPAAASIHFACFPSWNSFLPRNELSDPDAEGWNRSVNTSRRVQQTIRRPSRELQIAAMLTRYDQMDKCFAELSFTTGETSSFLSDSM